MVEDQFKGMNQRDLLVHAVTKLDSLGEDFKEAQRENKEGHGKIHGRIDKAYTRINNIKLISTAGSFIGGVVGGVAAFFGFSKGG